MPCEAQPLVESLKLTRQKKSLPLRLYQNEFVALIISGIGQTAVASAVGYLAGRLEFGHQPPNWLNFGIAGHPTAQPGKLFLVDQVSSSGSSWNYRVKSDCSTNLPRCNCLSANQIEQEFNEPVLYDMECAGFFQSALKFANAEHVYSAKLVSDNRQSGTGRLDKNSVVDLVRDAVPELMSNLITPLINESGI